MANAPNTLVIAAPQFREIFVDDVLVTPTGGTQGRLADKLSGAGAALQTSAVVANAQAGVLPANNLILYVLLRETAGHSVSVGLGSTAGANDVAAPALVPANGTLTIPVTDLLKNWFSATDAQALFLTSAAWGAASINASIVYQIGP